MHGPARDFHRKAILDTLGAGIIEGLLDSVVGTATDTRLTIDTFGGVNDGSLGGCCYVVVWK